ncbi:hypothetical protein [Alteromonas sp. KUL49]|uniref:hypothetical protein n=1 Tax=Alteromonas sp. KUL49 TaxID=2480798 RepID=UPI00102F0FBF|nr:hypothetical protein [Alteromonas sp. KUL49]TAP40856.1 hypothetical protein EYS00_07025 [Alteromonas sp. KUL49]GEA11035.1 hypothetical protein KUL49_14100 [Alteromonas sp. KUL49]
MKSFLLWIGFITLVIALTHGFITGQSIVHSLLLHPLVILLSFVLIAFGVGGLNVERKSEE